VAESVTENTLLLRFAGPAQSWASAPYAVKATEGVPTRAGVLGMIAAALGAPRGDYPRWLHALDISVRVDRAGDVVQDFHTITSPPADIAQSRTRGRLIASLGQDTVRSNYTVPNGAGTKWGEAASMTMITKRSFLADAEFIVALNHPAQDRLDQIEAAFREPVYPTYLGRKAFAPAFPFNLGQRAGAAHEVLEALPTSNPDGQALAIHRIDSEQNYASAYVTPDPLENGTWNGWAA
jgi:CRISPR system Cascade subunit CasD